MIHYVFSLCKKYRNKLQSADLYLQKGFGTLCAFTLRKIRLFRVRIYFFLMISCFSQSFNYWSFSCRIKGLPSTILVSISLCNQMVTCSSLSCLIFIIAFWGRKAALFLFGKKKYRGKSVIWELEMPDLSPSCNSLTLWSWTGYDLSFPMYRGLKFYFIEWL